MQNESDLKLKKQKEFLIKFCYFGVIIGTTIIIIKVLGSILTPFLIAFIIAAILNPLIKFSCKKLHINRAIISILFVLTFYTVASFIIILIGSKLLVLLQSLFTTLPQFFTTGSLSNICEIPYAPTIIPINEVVTLIDVR